MNPAFISVAVSLVCSILLFVLKEKGLTWLRKRTLYTLGRLVVVFWGISFLLLGGYFRQTALPLSSLFSALFFVLGVQVTLWALGVSLQIIGNVPNAPETVPESSLRHRPSDSGWSPIKEQLPIETKQTDFDEKQLVKTVGLPDKLWFRTIERSLSVLASLTVVGGIWFGIYKLNLSNTIEKRRVAVEAISQTRSAEFLRDYRNLKTAYQTKQIESKEKVALVDSLNHVMNVYDHIAILYISNIADKCIIKNSIYSGVSEMSAICDSMSYPSEYRTNFDRLLILMEREYCDTSGLSPAEIGGMR